MMKRVAICLILSLSGCSSLQVNSEKNVEEHYAKAENAYQAGEYQYAIQHFESLLAQQPDHAQAHFRLGNIALREGRLDDARRRYEMTLRIAPKHEKAHYNLATVYLTLAETHFHFYTANSHDGSQQTRVQNLVNAIEKFANQGDEKLDALGVLAERLSVTDTPTP